MRVIDRRWGIALLFALAFGATAFAADATPGLGDPIAGVETVNGVADPLQVAAGVAPSTPEEPLSDEQKEHGQSSGLGLLVGTFYAIASAKDAEDHTTTQRACAQAKVAQYQNEIRRAEAKSPTEGVTARESAMEKIQEDIRTLDRNEPLSNCPSAVTEGPKGTQITVTQTPVPQPPDTPSVPAPVMERADPPQTAGLPVERKPPDLPWGEPPYRVNPDFPTVPTTGDPGTAGTAGTGGGGTPPRGGTPGGG